MELNDWGTVEFVSGCGEGGMTDDLSFYLMDGETVLYSFPQESEARGSFDEILAVGFRDINSDGKKDVIIIYTYMTGAGPQGAVPRPFARIYTAGKNEFYLEEIFSEDLYLNMPAENYTIENICNYFSDHEWEAGGEAAGYTSSTEAYKAALHNLINNHIFPDGTEAENASPFSMSENKFAITDIDQDGREELLISYQSATMAGMLLGVYDYNVSDGKMNAELTAFPAAAFFDNGIVTVQASHNHGKSATEDFWPYGIYEYDGTQDQYMWVTGVDAWQKEVYADGFPEDADVDKDGLVYYLTVDSSAEAVEIMDGSDYETWKDRYIGDADEIQIDWLATEEDTVNKL